MRRYRAAIALSGLMIVSACGHKPAPTPPPPPAPQNIFALLPEPTGDITGIVVRNQAGSQELVQANHAVRVDRADVAPGAPYVLTDPDVRRLFGSAIDVLPLPEVGFLLHFAAGSENLDAESLAKIPSIIDAIRERRSTSITVTGHTDTTDRSDRNYLLGMARAQNVAALLLAAKVKESDLVISSHGDADLLVKTPRGQPNAENRRVEVIVR